MTKNDYKFTKRYKIVVTEICDEETLTNRKWVANTEQDSTIDKYGYTQQVLQITKVEREIYSQNVGELDVRAVIGAVNKRSGEKCGYYQNGVDMGENLSEAQPKEQLSGIQEMMDNVKSGRNTLKNNKT